MTVPKVDLMDGAAMPQVGFGVFQVSDDEAERAVATALREGYRSVDTASAYGNETGVGRALRASGVPREELFVTTKLWNDAQGFDNALRACEASLSRLGLDYLDLYLIHWPMPDRGLYLETWRALERLKQDGRVRSIGVSNFTVETLQRIIDEADAVPVVNQIELHPYFQQDGLRAFHRDHGIRTEAWAPLGQGHGLLDDPALAAIARAHDRTPAQVALRWHLQIGNVVIPKSVTPSRIAENIDVFGFELSPDDMKAIGELNKGVRFGPDPVTFGAA
ncbi:diketogulonate reductase-like aldo/keto reductase [Actinomadura pelletieri DSM 43383]|uniref:Diketogulonate reductase-like aldo/keto reductase n=2 Tax=Actinomadura pelletieri TaxID=111805 RepID=A0A495QBR2_9ACTN|nr:diketogulonate reductase-like aldo/keto reductase [Actinomadura pelletieri DSM 43383]